MKTNARQLKVQSLHRYRKTVSMKDIDLAFNCTEKINDRRYCEKCAHTLTDFTNKTDAELEDALSNASRPVCGVFKKSQLSEQFLKYAATTFLAASWVNPSWAQHNDVILKPTAFASVCESKTVETHFQGMVVSTPATPAGGYDQFYGWLYDKVLLPPDLTQGGELFLELSVDETGNLKDYRIVSGFDKRVDEEVIRVIKTYGYPFTPGRQSDKPLPVRLIIPITIDPAKKK